MFIDALSILTILQAVYQATAHTALAVCVCVLARAIRLEDKLI